MNTPFTFKDTGITVSIRKVSPLLLAEVQRKLTPPKPPKNKIEIDGHVTYEDNYADPDYLMATQDHQVQVEATLRKTLIKFGIQYCLTEEDTKQVQELRDFWTESGGAELGTSDLEVFISYIAIGTVEDLQELMEAVTRRNLPTEGAIAEAIERFPAETSG